MSDSEVDTEGSDDNPIPEMVQKRTFRWWINSAPTSAFVINVMIVIVTPILIVAAIGGNIQNLGQLELMSWLSIGGIPLIFVFHYPLWVYFVLGIVWFFTLVEYRMIPKVVKT